MKRGKYATPFDILHAVSLLSHRERIGKFDLAISSVISTDSYVVDMGTGSGVLAMLAARAGAEHVSAIDVNPECIDYARRTAEANGLSDKIDFEVAHYADYFPDRRADLVICEMLSSMMLIEQQVPACAHAVKHILKPDGVILPYSAVVYVVPVESDALAKRFNIEDITFPTLPQTAGPDETRDMSDTQILTRFDFASEDTQNVDEVLVFEIVDEGTVHGFLGLFEADLGEDLTLKMDDGWRPLFLPLREEKEVSNGSTLEVRFRFTPGRYDSLSISVE
ncbi:MAG: 50S ribosomal protein L11 methyltransferase [Candidatus Thorarchaeota archaeon]|nr:MAG: 50S ribosomal protein L11 methyltransferase [Candidatus Thorarchaeota archaeon]